MTITRYSVFHYSVVGSSFTYWNTSRKCHRNLFVKIPNNTECCFLGSAEFMQGLSIYVSEALQIQRGLPYISLLALSHPELY